MAGQQRRKNSLMLFASALILVFLLGAAQFNGALFYTGNNPPYFHDSGSEGWANLPFRFEDRSVLLKHSAATPFARTTTVLSADFNSDGWDDFLLFGENIKKPALMLNQGGKSFRDATSEYLGFFKNKAIWAANTADLDNDGFTDLVVTPVGEKDACYILKGTGKTFIPQESWACQVPGDKRTISFFDWDNDGFLDVLFFSFYAEDLEPGWVHPDVRSKECGQRSLLRNNNGKKFELVSAVDLGGGSCAFSGSIADFNSDGLADVFLPVDFGLDRFFLNVNGKGFQDFSRDALGFRESRYSMGSESADLFGEGRPGVYATNVNPSAGMPRGFNRLWWNRTESSRTKFEDIAQETGTSKCGHAWDVRFIDPNRDGYPDMFVVNAPYQSGGRSWYWLKHASVMEINLQKKLTPQANLFSAQPGKGEENCLFINSGKVSPWKDVAVSAGLSDRDYSRSVAVMDYNNDGQEDLATISMFSEVRLYEGRYRGENKWVGIRLEGTTSNRDAIGASVSSKFKGRLQTKYVAATGYLSRRSLAQILAVPAGEESVEVEIHWPSGKKQTQIFRELNRYHTVREAP